MANLKQVISLSGINDTDDEEEEVYNDLYMKSPKVRERGNDDNDVIEKHNLSPYKKKKLSDVNDEIFDPKSNDDKDDENINLLNNIIDPVISIYNPPKDTSGISTNVYIPQPSSISSSSPTTSSSISQPTIQVNDNINDTGMIHYNTSNKNTRGSDDINNNSSDQNQIICSAPQQQHQQQQTSTNRELTNPNTNSMNFALTSIYNDDSTRYVDITKYLNMPQSMAAEKLGIPTSTLSKRWKEVARNRKWPYRTVSKLDKEIMAILHNIPQGSNKLQPDMEATLGVLLRRRQEELRPVRIRL